MLAAAAAGPASAACKLIKVAELPVTMTRAAQPVISAKINGVDARLVADSGAFFSMLSPSVVQKFGLNVGPAPFGLRLRGVGGDEDVRLATAKSFTLLTANFSHADFLVANAGLGEEADGVIGQNLLNIMDVEYDLANGVIRLFKPEGCSGVSLAYWAKDVPYSVIDIAPVEPGSRKIAGTVKINGQSMRAVFDTGSWRSILTTQAAARAGVKPDMPGVVAAGSSGGIGRRAVSTWVAPFDSFAIGDEQISNTRLRMGGIELDNEDMLIGADFFLSHRVLVANSQRRLYFSYNGGPVFRLDQAPAAAQAQAAAGAAASPVAPTAADEPTDAAGFGRRGSARAARREFDGAISDFSRAAELEPNDPQHLFDRGLARAQNRQPVLAMADMDQALKLKPDFAPALLTRGELHLGSKDEAGAKADFEAAARVDPYLRFQIGDAYQRAGDTDAAIGQYDQWIEARPKDEKLAFVLNARCWARALAGREPDKALADCTAALKLKPHTSEILDSRGLACLRLGDLDGAIADYDEAIRLQPKSAWSLYGRGVARLKKGLKAEGEADIAAATTLAPRLPDEARRHGVTP
jgi:tetratricopeptide (TPR) repeat protein